ncbi:MAG: hypothetical protein ACI9YL_002247, partial [Luteibaculaceae bacterium]
NWGRKLGGDGFFSRFSPDEKAYFCQGSSSNFNSCGKKNGLTFDFASYMPSMPLNNVTSGSVNKIVRFTYSGQPFYWESEEKIMVPGYSDIYSLNKHNNEWCPSDLKWNKAEDINKIWKIEGDLRKIITPPGADWRRPIAEVESNNFEDNPWMYMVYSGIFEGSEQGGVQENPALFRVRKNALADGDWSKTDILEELSFTGGPNINQEFHLEGGFYPITGIAVHPENSDIVWISFAGHDERLKVWKSIDAGENWTNMDPNLQLPNISVNDILYIPGTDAGIILGTDGGLFWFDEGQEKWCQNNDFPRCRVVELKLNPQEDALYVGTWGRGIWKGEFKNPSTWIKPDLYSKDHNGDLGNEPSEQSVYWESPALTIDPAVIQYQVNNDEDYTVKLKIINRGTKNSAEDVPVTFYWALAGAGQYWPSVWKGQDYCDALNELPRGGYIGQGLLPSLEPYQSYELVIPWDELPNPADYAARCNYSSLTSFHVCLTAIIDETAINLSVGNNWSHTANVLSKNNVVQKNVHLTTKKKVVLVNEVPTQLGAVEILILNEGVSDEITFKLDDLTEGDIVKGDVVKVRLESILMQKWLAGGKKGKNIHLETMLSSELPRNAPSLETANVFEQVATSFIVLDSAHGSIVIPDVPKNYQGLQYIAFHDSLQIEMTGIPAQVALILEKLVNYISSAEKEYVGDFRLTMESKSKGVIGGNTFKVHGVKGVPILDLLKGAKQKPESKGLLEYAAKLNENGEVRIRVYPNPADTYIKVDGYETKKGLKYSIVDVQGKQKQNGIFEKHIPINPWPQGNYYILVQDQDQLLGVHSFYKK